MKENEIAESSYSRYRVALDKARPFLPEMINQVELHHVEKYRDWLVREGYRPETVILEIRVLHNAFEKAIRLGYMKANPVKWVQKPKKPESTVEPYTDEELRRVFGEINRRTREGFREQGTEAWKRYENIFYCLFFTGMRISDVLNMRWSNLDPGISTITMRQKKTGKKVIIRIPTELKKRLMRVKKEGGSRATDIVFQNTRGEQVLYCHMDKAIRDVLNELGMRKKSPLHSFRHTVAIKLLEAGIPVHEVANQLGDSVETVVRNYVKPRVPTLDDMDRALNFVTANVAEILTENPEIEESVKNDEND